MNFLFALFSFGEVFVIGIIAVLLFGKELPQMGKKFGKYYAEFKRGYQNVQNEFHSVISEIEDVSDTPAGRPRKKQSLAAPDEDHVLSAAPRFEPPADE